MYNYKKILQTFIIGFSVFLCNINIYANGEDNANSGGGDVGSAMDGKAYYIGSEYMYKVSVYVAKGDTVNETHDLGGNWYKIGNEPIFVRPDTYTLPNNLWATPYNKYDYNNGAYFDYYTLTETLNDNNTPPPPIVSDGNLSDVKHFFGSINTLDNILEQYATIEGTTIEGLVSDLQFQFDGEWDYQDPTEILPDYNPILEEWTNHVSWLVMYEPLHILYLKPDNNGYRQPVAFTGTELAILQKEGMLDFFYQPYSQFVASYTHKALPNSVVLEKHWVGLLAYAPLQPWKFWSDDRIIAGGAVGMRMLNGNPEGTDIEDLFPENPEDPTNPDGDGNGGNGNGGGTDTTNPDGNGSNGGISYGKYTYRTDTNVITSFVINAKEDVLPDDRVPGYKVEGASFNDTHAYVTITVEGAGTYTEAVALPKGSSTYVWVQWRTPSYETDVKITATVENNEYAEIFGYGENANITAKIVDINTNIPPDHGPHDKMPFAFRVPKSVPKESSKTEATWHTVANEWIPNIIWFENLVWHSDWKYIDNSYTIIDDEGNEQEVENGYWVDRGEYVDEGWWEDHGIWSFETTIYEAELEATMDVKPSNRVPTSEETRDGTFKMASGYGYQVDVKTRVTGDTGSVTKPQNVVTFFPEFYFKENWRLQGDEYWRVLEETSNGTFNFKYNKYSIATIAGNGAYKEDSRVHYTPLPYPNDEYHVYANVIDAWTPDGMMRINVDDMFYIDGDLYDDWQITRGFPDSWNIEDEDDE